MNIQLQQLLKQGNGNLEEMQFGMMKNKSYFGYNSQILKSGICKYFRRQIFDKFEWCCIEMLIFGIQENKKCGLVTNIINRLKILLMEEICCDSVNLVVAINYLESASNEENILIKIKNIKVFCDYVNNSKRGRICSYINKWWQYNPINYEDEIELNHVLKYKKDGDSNSLLILGERLVKFIIENNEQIFDIYNKLFEYDKSGKRYNRYDGIYIYWQIIDDYFCNDINNINSNNNKIIFDFALNMFHRKTMKERRAFGIWIGLMLLNKHRLNYNDNYIEKDIIIENYIVNRHKINIDEDFVIRDWHINKRFGKKSFANVGSMVIDEDGSLLGENYIKYKEFYVEKTGKDIVKKKKNAKDNKKSRNKNEKVISLDFNETFDVIEILHEGVCGMKKPCLIVDSKMTKKRYVLKEMSIKGMNAGKDYMFLDSLKEEFGIINLKMKRIKTNIGFSLIDKQKRKYKNNCQLKEQNYDIYYCLMKYYDNIGDLGNNKMILEDTKLIEEMLKIRLFDGLFRSSDNNMRNILVTTDNKLISIDEGDIFGKRKNIFDKNDWCKKNTWCCEHIERIINEFILKEGRLEIIKNKLKEYDYEDVKLKEFEERYNNFIDIVKSEFN